MSTMIDGPRFCGARLPDAPPRLCNKLKGHDGACGHDGTVGLCSLIAGEPQCSHRPCGCFPAKTAESGSVTPERTPRNSCASCGEHIGSSYPCVWCGHGPGSAQSPDSEGGAA